MAVSRKDLILAAAWIAAGVTYNVHPNDREDEQEDILNFALKYLPLATDMAEAAWNISMQYPDGYYKSCYDDFGIWVFEQFNENDCDEPAHDEVVNWLINNTCIEFDDVMTNDQVETLRRNLIELGEQFTPV